MKIFDKLKNKLSKSFNKLCFNTLKNIYYFKIKLKGENKIYVFFRNFYYILKEFSFWLFQGLLFSLITIYFFNKDFFVDFFAQLIERNQSDTLFATSLTLYGIWVTIYIILLQKKERYYLNKNFFSDTLYFANRLTSVQFNVIYSTIFVTINIFAYVLQWNFLFFILYSIIVTIYSILLFLFQTFKTDAALYFKAQKNYFNSGFKSFMKSSKVNFYTKCKEDGYDTKWIFKYDEKTVLKEINNNLNFKGLNLFFQLLPEDLVIYKEKQFNFYKELLNLYSYNFFNKEITDGFFLYQIPLILDKFNKFMTALPNNKEYSTTKYLLLREFMWQIKSFLESNKIKKRFVCPSEKFWKYFNIFDSKSLNEMFLVYVRNKTMAMFLKLYYNDKIKKYAKKSNLKKVLVLPQLINDIEEADGKIKNIINGIYGTSEEILKKIKSKISESEREMEKILNKYKDYINL